MDSIQRRIAIVSRPWRIVFVLYALAMLIGAHWPRLEMAVGGQRAPDKIIHMLAFAGLTFLLWRTRWFGAGWRLALVIVLWVLVMELTQSLPAFGRRFSWLDMLAGWCGVALALAWIRAMQPIGGTLNRMRQRINSLAVDDLFVRWRTWLLAGVAGTALAILAGGGAILIMWRVHPDGVIYTGFIAVPAAGIGGAYAMLDLLWRRMRDQVSADQRCAFCGKVCAEIPPDAIGMGACPSCQRPFHVAQWRLRAELPRWTLARISVWPILLSVALSVLAAAVYLVGLALYVRYPATFGMLQRFDRMPLDLRLVLDMTLIGVILAIAANRFRARTARIVDHQHERCRRCGHDVHATAVQQGMGRCPECATEFLRLDDLAMVQLAAAHYPVRQRR